jgi:hypothetical protein
MQEPKVCAEREVPDLEVLKGQSSGGGGPAGREIGASQDLVDHRRLRAASAQALVERPVPLGEGSFLPALVESLPPIVIVGIQISRQVPELAQDELRPGLLVPPIHYHGVLRLDHQIPSAWNDKLPVTGAPKDTPPSVFNPVLQRIERESDRVWHSQTLPHVHMHVVYEPKTNDMKK